MIGNELWTQLERVKELGGPIKRIECVDQVGLDHFRADIGPDAAQVFFSLAYPVHWDAAWLIIGALVEDARAQGMYRDVYERLDGVVQVSFGGYLDNQHYGAEREAKTELEATLKAYIATLEQTAEVAI